MARPSVTDPPGELMYSEMSFSGSSASSSTSWAQTRLAVTWSMALPMKTMRSFSRRWKMSPEGSPAPLAPTIVGRSDALAMGKQASCQRGQPVGTEPYTP